jgi:Fe-S-cluster containining protein
MQVNFRSFKQKLRYHKKAFRSYLRKLEKNPPKNLDSFSKAISDEVWKEVDCLSCANCCKKMSPTFTDEDITRISSHFEMTTDEFKKKWLKYWKKDGDWMNVSQPCQFLDLTTNMCSIYEVRPADCAGFPHLTKRKMKDYLHVHQQNIEYCPATYKMVEKMMELKIGV